MRRVLLTVLAAGLLAGAMLHPPLVRPLRAENRKPAPPPSLKVGDTAPDFKLEYFDGASVKQVTLSQYRGKKNVVLAFYIFAFTPG